MGMIQEFRNFAMRGNVIDMAVGIVIGAGFGKVVNDFVEKIVMPLIGMLGGIDLSSWDIVLKKAVTTAEGEMPAVMLGVGSLATSAVQFLIVAFAVFLVVKAMNNARAVFETQKSAAPPAPPEDVQLLREIRDSLQKR